MNVINPSPDDLKYFQINHYSERLAKATGDKEKRFLKKTLSNLKTDKNGSDNLQSFHGMLHGGDRRLFNYICLPLLPQKNNYSGERREYGIYASEMAQDSQQAQKEQDKI